MPLYYSTFPSGFEPAVEEFLQRDMPGVQLVRMMDGAVEYRRTGAPVKQFPKWFNNSFLILTSFPRANRDPLQEMVRLAAQRGVDTDTLTAHLPPNATGFRAMFMIEGILAHAGLKTMAKAEEFLTVSAGLTPERARPDVEFWYLYRREGLGFLLMRLTQHKDTARELSPGELRPDIAQMLCRLSGPKPTDVFLDPFAGYGGIVKARLSGPAASITAGDIRPTPQLTALQGKAQVVRMDALNMAEVVSGSVDAIVTDPPWGQFEPLPDPTGFYGRFLAEARRVLKKGGRLVLLTGLKREAEAALKLGFAIDQRLDVLVSGKKAAVFVCRNVK